MYFGIINFCSLKIQKKETTDCKKKNFLDDLTRKLWYLSHNESQRINDHTWRTMEICFSSYTNFFVAKLHFHRITGSTHVRNDAYASSNDARIFFPTCWKWMTRLPFKELPRIPFRTKSTGGFVTDFTRLGRRHFTRRFYCSRKITLS